MTPNRRTKDLARTAAESFDATVLHNRVYEQVQGQHESDAPLRQVVKLSEECYDLAAERTNDTGRDDDVRRATWDSAESLHAVIDDLVDEEIATACSVIITDAPEWTDHWDEAELEAAAHEAREWLQLHVEAAERAEVLDALEVRA